MLSLTVGTDAVKAQRTGNLLALLTFNMSLTISAILHITRSISIGYMHHNERIIIEEDKQLLGPVEHQYPLDTTRDAFYELVIGIEYKDTVETVLVMSVVGLEGVIILDGF